MAKRPNYKVFQNVKNLNILFQNEIAYSKQMRTVLSTNCKTIFKTF